MSTNGPHVFVSSTCFDLSEVRETLSAFITQIGYHPILSEHPAFPVNPDETTENNCIHNIHSHADIFVLIVGKRSGTPSSTNRNRSITNTEYLHARAKGIPVYVFIDVDVNTWHSLWKANPDAIFPGLDSNRLLEFVDQISTSTSWRFHFKRAADITDVLRLQWASLVKECLALRMKMKAEPLLPSFPDLSERSRQIIIERPANWEYHLFSSVLTARMAQLRPRRMDALLKLHVAQLSERVPPLDFSQWIIKKLGELHNISNGLMALMSETSLVRAFGPLGLPGNPEEIVYLADRIITQYEQMLIWKQSVQSSVSHECLEHLKDLSAQYSASAIEDVERFVAEVHDAVTDLLVNPPAEGENRSISICLELRAYDGLQSQINLELERVIPILADIASGNN